MATRTTTPGGEAIYELRRELGLTQDQMSERTGVNQGYISLIERGERDLTATVVRRYARGLDLDGATTLRLLEHSGGWLTSLVHAA